MSEDWKIGDVAMLTTEAGHEHLGLVVQVNANLAVVSPGYSLANHRPSRDAVVYSWGRKFARRLVVIDPEDREQVERVLAGYHGWKWEGVDAKGASVTDMQAALRKFANPTPPKPEEPTGLGAVVEDADGAKWMRTLEHPAFHPWAPVGQISVDLRWRSYADITAVRILSPGVTA